MFSFLLVSKKSMKLIKKVPTFLWLIVITFAFIQHATAFKLRMDWHYFSGTDILTWNWAEVQFTDENIWYWAFFLWSWINTNTTLKIWEDRQINCKKQLNWYYTMLFTNFLMFWIDSNTATNTYNQRLTPDTTFNWAWLYYDCTARSPNSLNIDQKMKWVYWRVWREYWSWNWKNTGAIRAWIEKNNNTRQRSNSSKLELVLSTSTWYISKTLSWSFIGSVEYYIPSQWNSIVPNESSTLRAQRILYTWHVNPRPIWDIRINNYEEYDEDWVFVVPFENYRRWMDITVVTSKPGVSTNVVINWQYEDKYQNTGVLSSPLQIFAWSIPSGQIPYNNGLFTWAFWFHWYKNLKYSWLYSGVQHYYRHLSWTITLNIPSENWSRTIKFRVEWEPCLTWWDNDYFITPDFWNLNREKWGPTKAQIKCAIFWYADDVYNESNGAGYETAYTKGRNGYGETSCTDLNVITTWSLPSTLTQKTIYILTSTLIDLPANITIPNCTAIISKANAKLSLTDGGSIERKIYYWRDTTLNKLITINGSNIVLDNISIKWNAFNTNWITITNNKKNITLNVVKVYNNNIWIYLNKATNIILNNIQSFNNNVWIQLTDSNTNSISNSQIYRNNTWVVLNRAAEGSQNNVIYNSAIYQNNEWLRVIWTNTNDNRFDNIDVYDNRYNGRNGQEWNIYIQKWLRNIWNNIRIQSRNNIPVSITERIDWFNRIEDNLESYNPYKYTCKWWTIWTCLLLLVEASQVKYYCTWAINPNYENAKKDFTADWLHQNENLRTLSIEWENYANFDTYIYNESWAGSHIHFWWDIQFSWNVDSYRFNWSNINWTLTPLASNIVLNGKNYSYEVSVTYDEMTFTGYWNEEINHHIVQWIWNSVTQVWNKLCEHDGWLSWLMSQLSPLTHPSVNINNGTSTITNIFSNNPIPDELLCSWANCFTNPKLSWWQFSFLIPWNTYYYWNIWTLIDVTDYSYWIGQRRQDDILLPWWVTWGKTNYKSYYWWYFIWSNVPAQSIERSKINVITKINYEIWWRTNNSHGGNKFNIISFINRFPTGPLDTIVSYVEWTWRSLPNRTWQQTRNSRTNTYTWLNNGSSTVLFLEPWDTTHYPVVLQTYWDRYFATHRWMTRLARDNLYIEIQPINQCLPPYIETIAMTWQWLTHENEGIAFNYEKWFPLVWANVTWVSQNQIQIDSNTNTTATMTDFSIIKSETWATKRNLTIPCTTWNVCYARISIRNPGIIRDILEFQSRNTIKTYQRDMKWPGIMLSATWAVECRDTTLRVKLNDSCIWTSGFMISWFFNTWWLTLETNNRNEDRYDVIIDSWTVGRTWKDANGQILHKTWIIYAKDKYDNETTGSIDIKMVDELVTITTWYTIATAFDLLNWERIEEHGRSTWIDVVELYWVTEWEYCWIQDLYLTWFKCFNYKDDYELWTENRALTWHINWHILTISPRQESDYYAYNSWVICKINIKDNEENTVTWFMIFNINTVHKPLFEEPVIIWWTKYSEYSWSEYRSYTKRNNLEYENLNTGRNNSYEDRKYLSGEYSKYTSGDIVLVSPWDHNKYTKRYHISCTDYYTGTDNSQRKFIPEWYPYRMDFDGINDIENCGTWQIRLKVSIWNWWENGNNEIFGNNLDQFATGITDYIFYDNTPANIKNTNEVSYDDVSQKIIITSWHTVIQDYVQVKDPEHNAIDIRPTVPWYTDHSIILNTWILSLKLTGWITTLKTEMFAKIEDNTSTQIRSRNTTVSWTILKDTDEHIHEQQICLDIWTWLLRDFAKVPANPDNTCTKYRYTSENPLYIEGGKRWRNDTPEHDISVLRVKVDSGVIDTWLHFTLLTAKPINNIDDIECSLYNTGIWWFNCTGISWDAQKIDNDRIVCTSRDTEQIIPICNDWQLNTDWYNYHLVWTYPGDRHRRAQFSRKYTINFEIYSGEANSWYYNQHTWEWQFFGNVKIKDENKVFNDSYVVVELYENKTPFKQWPQWSENYWYWNLVDALALWSWDNGFLFYISWPQKINEWNIKSWVVWDISYEITFSDDVASEFYEITWEAIVNKFKKTLFIKRPTFNFANPKGYLFNFPDYDWFNP